MENGVRATVVTADTGNRWAVGTEEIRFTLNCGTNNRKDMYSQINKRINVICMRKFFCILLTALLVVGSCDKDEQSSLENETNDLKDNIAALERCATTVNSNITALQNIVAALQNMDNVTGVTTFTTPSPGGYVISFVKSGSIVISNGTDGAGESPQISVKQDVDGVYYWTLTGEWIVAGGNKMRVAGADSSAEASPKVRVNSGTGLWEISCDAGSSWTTAEIEATGDKGDAVFAVNGVNYSNSDYVEFTLANGTGKIRVPKYKILGLNYAQPETFVAGETKTVSYTPEGNVTIIKFLNLSAGWNVNVNYTEHKFTVTSPATFNSNNRGGEIVILVSDDEQNTIMRTINLISNLGGGDEGGSGGGGSDDGGDNIGGGGDGTPSNPAGYISIEGYYSENTITVYYIGGTHDRITKSADNSLGDNYYMVPANNKIIEKIDLLYGTTIYVGRKADGSNIPLKLAGGNLVLRDAVDGYIPIGTYSEFRLIGTRLDGSYRQEANLDLHNREWSPINSFKGTFDGNNHTLEHLKISGKNDYAGLFGYNMGAIRNVHVISGSVSGKNYVGGICGWNGYNYDYDYNHDNIYYNINASISGCSNASEVLGESNIGGVCGSSSSSITACYNTGSVSGSDYIGGVCGYFNSYPSGSSSSSIIACYWKDIAGDRADYGIGYDLTTEPTDMNTTKFTSRAWPTSNAHEQWGTGDGSGDGKYWKSLGSWNGGNPIYPKLWFE
jgi:hypothetical protein